MPRIYFEKGIIDKGKKYCREYLRTKWGYKGIQAIQRGLITPKGQKLLVFFITKKKKPDVTQYPDDELSGDILTINGEKKHRSDQRIANSKRDEDQVHLFYRDRYNDDFEYHGRIELLGDPDFQKKRPSRFTFRLVPD